MTRGLPRAYDRFMDRRFDLPRMHLFELNDSPWVPGPLRDTIIESLSRTLSWGRMMAGMVAPFEAFVAASGSREVLDIGAGAGGPARILAREIGRAGRTPPRFVLTDLKPQVAAWDEAAAEHPGVITFEPGSIDATRIPDHVGKGRARMIINVLHHFEPALATRILEDAVAGSRGVFIAEGFERNPLRFASFAPTGVPALLLNPVLSSRDRVAKACFTWLTPVAIAASLWDGIVSTLRVYTEAELRAMVAPFGDAFTWIYGTYDYVPGGRGYYFYGVPRTG